MLWHQQTKLYKAKLINYIVRRYFERYGGLKFILHSSYDTRHMNIPIFCKDLLIYFSELHENQLKFGGVLWNNKEFSIGGRCLYNKEWHDKGIIYIKDLLDNENKLLTIPAFKNKFNINIIDLLWFNGLKIQINKWLKIKDN